MTFPAPLTSNDGLTYTDDNVIIWYDNDGNQHVEVIDKDEQDLEYRVYLKNKKEKNSPFKKRGIV